MDEFIEVEENHCVNRIDIERTMLMFVTEDDRCLLLSVHEEHDVMHTAGLGAIETYLAHNSLLETVIEERVYMDRRFCNRIIRFYETHEGNNIWLHISFLVGEEVKILKIYGCSYVHFKEFVCDGKSTITDNMSAMYL
jgi:hypothetical protein